MSVKTPTNAAMGLPESLVAVEGEPSTTRRFLKSSLLFVLIGALIYLALYAASEALVYQYTKRNRFFEVKTAPFVDYDYVILGASHAAALDYDDMTPQLEQMTHSKIINLSEVGAGIFVNRLLLNYFLIDHRAKSIVYVVDSFAFYSREWNEDRLSDTSLFNRAPFDPALVSALSSSPAGRSVLPDYILGFSKINNPDRFTPDISADEAKFNTTYHPVKQIDQQRITYLYPNGNDQATFADYLGQFEDLLRYSKEHNIRFIVIKPPVPTRFYQMLPQEAQFDQRLKALLAQYGVEFHDFSLVGNDERFFFNPDHLNKSGVLNFYDNSLKPLLAP